jgi:hypothetical protein
MMMTQPIQVDWSAREVILFQKNLSWIVISFPFRFGTILILQHINTPIYEVMELKELIEWAIVDVSGCLIQTLKS